VKPIIYTQWVALSKVAKGIVQQNLEEEMLVKLKGYSNQKRS
jgi:hypothetical protein